MEPDQLRRLFAGAHPSAEIVLRATGGARVAAFDLTFSAPKSVSVLFGLGGDAVQSAVRLAHDRAVQQALAYLEHNAAAVRRGHSGAVVLPADGLVAAVFRHRTSRAGDPQLHSHIVIANVGFGADRRWTALDGSTPVQARRDGEPDLPGGPAGRGVACARPRVGAGA